jgi:alpha-ketoglutaric semialdehyde dehydrogenase
VTLTGHSLIAGQPVHGGGKTAFGFNPATNEALEPPYSLLTEEQLTTATSAAAQPTRPSAPLTRKPTHASWKPSRTTSTPSATN